MNDNLPTRSELAVVDAAPVSAKQLQQQVNVIQEAMRQVMEEGVHFGRIPGCGDKPGLFKPGAEKLSLMFRLNTSFDVTKLELGNGHREYSVVCSVRDVHGRLIGQGVSSCSTMESKYRYRNGERVCPACGKPTIIKGKAEFGGGWLCFAKKGGCGAKFADGDKSVEAQQVGKVENPDIADVYNTVLKMAKKRAHVDGVLTTTGASDIFTQDIEDMGPAQYGETRKHVEPTPEPTYYDFTGLTLSAEQESFLTANCRFDETLGMWACPRDLGKKLEAYKRTRAQARPQGHIKPVESQESEFDNDDLPPSMGGAPDDDIPGFEEPKVDELKRIQERVRKEKKQKEAA